MEKAPVQEKAAILEQAPSEVVVENPPDIEEAPTLPPLYRGLEYREIIICNSLFDTSLKAFASYESYRMFKDFSKSWMSKGEFQRAKYNQNLTKGLPLMLSKRVWNWGVGDVQYLKLFDCLTSPEAVNRLYHKADNRLVATIYKKRFLRYTRFRLVMAGSTIVIFYHHLLEIADFEYDGKKFRFIKTDLNRVNLNHFAYDLFLLGADQQSLLDKMTANFKVANSNNLLGGVFSYMCGLRPSSIREHDLVSPHLWGKIQSCKRDALFSRTAKTCSFSLFTPVPPDLNMNSSVDKTSFVLTAICLILKSYEFDLMVQNAPIHPPLSAGGGHNSTVYTAI